MKNHESEANSILKRNKKYKCIEPGCQKESIFSHTISESLCLENISINGHVIGIKSRRIPGSNIKNLGFEKSAYTMHPHLMDFAKNTMRYFQK